MNTLVVMTTNWEIYGRRLLDHAFPTFTTRLKAIDDRNDRLPSGCADRHLVVTLQELLDTCAVDTSQSQQGKGTAMAQRSTLLTVGRDWERHEEFLYHFFSSRDDSCLLGWYTKVTPIGGGPYGSCFLGYGPLYFHRERPVCSLPDELIPQYGDIAEVILPYYGSGDHYGGCQSYLDIPDSLNNYCDIPPPFFDDFGAVVTLFLGGRRSMRLPMDTAELLEWFSAQSEYISQFGQAVELFRAGRQSLEVTQEDSSAGTETPIEEQSVIKGAR